MANYTQKILVNGVEYDLVAIAFHSAYAMNERDSATITMTKSYSEMVNLFPDGTVWKIKTVDYSPSGEPTERIDDYSDYCITGRIVDERDGKVTITMSKLTELERMIAIIYGGVNNGN